MPAACETKVVASVNCPTTRTTIITTAACLDCHSVDRVGFGIGGLLSDVSGKRARGSAMEPGGGGPR
jgi:hypothetical protein